MTDERNNYTQYFKAIKSTKRFKQNQKVWVTINCANHLYIRFKWRGNGRMVNGVIDRDSKCIGEIKRLTIQIHRLCKIQEI